MSGTSTLSPSEIGAYIRLLAWSWDNGAVPADAEKRARIIGADLLDSQRFWAAILDKWIATDLGFINRRLEDERRKQLSFRRLQASHGRKRWTEKKVAEPQPEHSRASSRNDAELLPSSASSSPSSSPISDLRSAHADPARDELGRVLSDNGGPAWNTDRRRQNSLAKPDHLRCFFAPDACARGWCIPAVLGNRWLPQAGKGDAEAGREDVKAFVAYVLTTHPPGPIGDAFEFWSGQWNLMHPATKRAVAGAHTPVDTNKYAGITQGDDDAV